MTQQPVNSLDLDLIEIYHDLYIKEDKRTNRTQYNTKSKFFTFIQHDMSTGFPLSTLRKTPLRWIFEETMFFARGETDTKILEDKGITIWKGNSSREFLDNKGHTDWPEGEIGPGSYGALWRNYPGNHGHGIDQLARLVDGLKNNPNDRRHLISAWHPEASLVDAALPACHIMHQYYVTDDGKLDTMFYMRSSDVVFGLPFNLAQYGLLNVCIAKLCGLEPGNLTYVAGDYHIYDNQLDMVADLFEQTEMMGVPALPKLEVIKQLKTLDDFLSLEWSDIRLVDYNPNPDFAVKPEMAV